MDNLTKAQRRKNMQNIRSKDSIAEKKLATMLRKQGLYFARNVKSLPGKPDIVFRKKKVAVFVDSDFWHCHPSRFIMPKSNLDYWRPKLERNKKRDKEVNRLLRNAGWKVIRVWELDIKEKADFCTNRILKALMYRGGKK